MLLLCAGGRSTTIDKFRLFVSLALPAWQKKIGTACQAGSYKLNRGIWPCRPTSWQLTACRIASTWTRKNCQVIRHDIFSANEIIHAEESIDL
jgi:hypothetical protein